MDIIDLKKRAKIENMKERLDSIENYKKELNKNLNILLNKFDSALIKETSENNFIYDKKSDTIMIKSTNGITPVNYAEIYLSIKEIINLFKNIKKSLGIYDNQYTHTFKDEKVREYEIINDSSSSIILAGNYKFNISYIQFHINDFKEVSIVIK